jgi:hypothetical protein
VLGVVHGIAKEKDWEVFTVEGRTGAFFIESHLMPVRLIV